MTRKRSGKLAAVTLVAVVAVLVTILPVLPAFAQHGQSASVNVTDVLANTPSKEFQITVNHNANPGGGTPIIAPPAPAPAINAVDITTPLPGYKIVDVIPPGTGWTFRIISNGRAMQATGGTIAPSGSGVFKVITDVPASDKDKTGKWVVQVSSDGGASASPELTGSLNTTLRVLSVENLAIQSPSGVLDGGGTAGQGAVQIQGTIRNVANIAKDVTGTLSDSGSKLTGDGDSLTETKTILPNGGTAPFNYTVKLGSAGSTTAKLDASAADSSSGPFFKNLPLTIEQAVDFNVIANSLDPRVVIPGQNVQFSVRMDKVGVPAITFDKANTRFRVPGLGINAMLVSPDSIGRNPQANQLFTFAVGTIDPFAIDGSFAADVKIAGGDDNSAGVDLAPKGAGNVRVDVTAPIIENLRGIAPASAVAGQPDAVSDARALGFGGDVKDTNELGLQVGCGPGSVPKCTIDNAFLTFYPELDGSGAPVGTKCVGPTTADPACTNNITLNNAGQIGGSYSGGYTTGTQSTQLTLVVRDEVGRLASKTGNIVEVDNIVPTFVKAEAIRVSVEDPVTMEPTTRQNRVKVTMSECTGPATGPSPRDFTMDGNAVLAVMNYQCSGVHGQQTFEVELLQDFPDDGPGGVLGTLTYAPGGVGGGTRMFDRVNLSVANDDLEVLDRLAPFLPSVDSINGKTTQDGSYWTNKNATTLTLSGDRSVVPGYFAEVYLETAGGDGLQRSADKRIARKQVLDSDCDEDAQGNPIDCSLTLSTTENGGIPNQTDFGAESEERKIYVVTLDTAPASVDGPNASPAALPPLQMDQKLATFASVEPLAGNQVQVTFTEKMPTGRNNTLDWILWDLDGNRLLLSSVTEGATSQVRILNVSSSIYNLDNVGSVDYSFFGPAVDRYDDRADNETPDDFVCFGDVPDDPRAGC